MKDAPPAEVLEAAIAANPDDLRARHLLGVQQLVSGKTEAIVIDSGFTRADALRVAANVLDSGKTLKTIFISNADPDFYFGAEVLKSHFPQAQVLTTPAVREKIPLVVLVWVDNAYGLIKW